MGIDPGTTVAYAVLDYQGRLVALKSAKNMKKDALITELATYSPSLIACDTNPPVKLASRLKACFSTRLYCPDESLSIEEKNKLAKTAATSPATATKSAAGPSPSRFRNAHERDALAAAVKAFHSVENKLRQVGARAVRAGASPEKAAHSQCN